MRRESSAGLRDGVLMALLALLLITTSACAGRNLSHNEMWGPFRGRFVDADTGQPIAGGVAYAVWYRIVFHPVHDRQEFYAVQFGVSDENGQYEIPALTPPLLSWIDGPFRSSVVPGHQRLETIAVNSHTVSKWRPFSRIPPAERSYATSGLYTSSIPHDRAREMLEQINVARQQMGLPPFRTLTGGLQ